MGRNSDGIEAAPFLPSPLSGAISDAPRPPLRRALLCTLGPSSLTEPVISGLAEAGATGFRLNMSHTDIETLESTIEFVQGCTPVPISIDTEGAQIRTGVMSAGVALVPGSEVRLVAEAIPGDAGTIPLTPSFAVGQLRPGARVSIDFDAALLRVDRVGGDEAVATVLSGGEVGSRKAVTALPSPTLPALSEKDLQAIRIARALGIREYALSFCEDAEAVQRLRALAGDPTCVMAKIESRRGTVQLEEIAQSADRLLIDRGDLSREVRLEAIPLLQKAIIRKANALRVPVYVATNLLESMVGRRVPTRAEVNDVINTLLDGADGLVLAAETAIGKYPVEAAQMIAALMREYTGSIDDYHVGELLGRHPLEAATPPHF
ncbi:MAG TPA: pyruvate kinase [Thermoplasmata archaeon]|nr:pyruvate kinase [Thermoplasmata archaeon]